MRTVTRAPAWLRLAFLALLALLAGCSKQKGNTPSTYLLEGTITSAIGAATDSDSNDAQTAPESNDTATTAQPLLNPVLLGGFVSATGTGTGNFADSGDRTDVFQATLAKGQTVALFISDHDAAHPYDIDLDLEIYDGSDITLQTQPVAMSISATEGTETVRVPENGNYYIFIRAIRGASNYLLTIGRPPNRSATTLRADLPFVPGEVVVRFKGSLHAASASLAFSNSTGLERKSGTPGQAMLFGLGGESRRRQTRQLLGIGQTASANPEQSLREETIAVVKALRKRSDVEYADLNYIRQAAAAPDDPNYPLQWNYPLINLPQAWDATTQTATTDRTTIVAVVDTGIFLDHPDLQGSLLAGYDFVSSPSIAADGDGIDGNPDDPGDGATPGGSSFHGTHVAGIIAAQTGNGVGVAGVSWGTNTKIMPVRVLGKGGGTTYDIIQGIRYAAGLSNDSGTVPPQRADIINLSLGGPGFSMAEQAEYNAVRDAGVIVVAAAGNDNSNRPSYPAAYDNVISVSAATMTRQKAPYSNFGPTIDIAAPGGNTAVDSDGDGYYDGILSTLVDDASGVRKPIYSFLQGTSMATPHVSGVIAIMKSLDPDLDPDKFGALLQTGKLTSDLGAPGRDDIFGFGLVDALKAVENIDIALPPIVAIDPPGPLDFGPFVDRLTFTTRNAGGGDFTITGISDDADWLETSPQSLPSSAGSFTVSVNRTGMPDGLYHATITVTTDNASTATIPVTLQVGERHDKGDTGHQYVVLVDPVSMETVRTVDVDNESGRYSYRIDDVPAGDYLIIAGTDLDNDGLICDPGEACGGYPTIERLQPVTVNSDVERIDFGTNFNIIIRALADDPGHPVIRAFSRFPDDY